MLYSLLLWVGSTLAWTIWTAQSGGGLLGGALLAAASVALAFRLGPFQRTRLDQDARLILFAAGRALAPLAEAFGVLRRIAAADVTLKPGLVRVKSALMAATGSVAPAVAASGGVRAIVVQTDATGYLLHVLDEDEIDARQFNRTEALLAGEGRGR